jgi:uncharacterized protein
MGTQSNQQFAVVTGGSKGIGLELARCAIANRFDVMIVADGPDVHEVATELSASGATVYAQQADLASYAGVEQVYAAIRGTGRAVDALLLNAGVGVGGRFLETSLEEELRMLALNCSAVVHLAKRVLPDMVARGQGRCLITSSIAGTMPASYEAVYGATKAFDLSFAEAVRYELKDTGVTVTALQPGPTDTAFFERANLEDTRVGQGEKDDPATVAKQGWEAMMDGKDKIIAGGLKTKMMGVANELLGEETKAKMHGKLAEPGSGRKH